jgi:hypothetical protein
MGANAPLVSKSGGCADFPSLSFAAAYADIDLCINNRHDKVFWIGTPGAGAKA